nr:response regulator [Rhodopirellula sp. JC639]
MVRRQIAQLPQETRHGIRNELHEITVGLHLYRELVRAGISDEADETFLALQESLKRLDANEAFRRPDAPPVTDPDRETIALIEDSANERRMLAELLQLKGYQVLEFSNGAGALKYFNDNDAPGLVLVDMNMPELDGRQTVTMMRQSERFRDVPIFAVSGTSPEENDLVMGRQGVDRWLPKPLSLETLMNSIRQTIGAPDTERPPRSLSNNSALPLSRVPSVAADLA